MNSKQTDEKFEGKAKANIIKKWAKILYNVLRGLVAFIGFIVGIPKFDYDSVKIVLIICPLIVLTTAVICVLFEFRGKKKNDTIDLLHYKLKEISENFNVYFDRLQNANNAKAVEDCFDDFLKNTMSIYVSVIELAIKVRFTFDDTENEQAVTLYLLNKPCNTGNIGCIMDADVYAVFFDRKTSDIRSGIHTVFKLSDYIDFTKSYDLPKYYLDDNIKNDANKIDVRQRLFDYNCLLTVPVIKENKKILYGFLSCDTKGTKAYTMQEQYFLYIFASNIALFIDTAKMKWSELHRSLEDDQDFCGYICERTRKR